MEVEHLIDAPRPGKIRVQDLSGRARWAMSSIIDTARSVAKEITNFLRGGPSAIFTHGAAQVYPAVILPDVHPVHRGRFDSRQRRAVGLQAIIMRGCTSDAGRRPSRVRRSGLNPVFMDLHGVDWPSVRHRRDSANRRDVERAVRDAEIVWFAGGDQCTTSAGQGNSRAAPSRVFKGGACGNSAGLAIRGDIAYAVSDVSAASKDTRRSVPKM